MSANILNFRKIQSIQILFSLPHCDDNVIAVKPACIQDHICVPAPDRFSVRIDKIFSVVDSFLDGCTDIGYAFRSDIVSCCVYLISLP